MNARVNPANKITKKQKKVLTEYIQDEIRKEHAGAARRLFKLMCVCLNDDFGFGAARLSKLISKISELSQEHEKDEVFWTHMDRRLEQMGVPFAKENYEVLEERMK
jgi:hypothetical protein